MKEAAEIAKSGITSAYPFTIEVVIAIDGKDEDTFGEAETIAIECHDQFVDLVGVTDVFEVRVIQRGECGGAAAARNSAVSHSLAPFLFFLDADDLFLPHHISACLSLISQPHTQWAQTPIAIDLEGIHPEWLPRIADVVPSNKCVTRIAHEVIGGFPEDEKFRRDGEDQFYFFALSLLFQKKTAPYDDPPSALYRIRDDNMLQMRTLQFRRPVADYQQVVSKDQQISDGKVAESIRHEMDTLFRRIGLTEQLLRDVDPCKYFPDLCNYL